MASTQATLDGIERRRVQLQESVEKLRKALTHWSTWEAEYQALKDDIESAEDASPAQIRVLAQKLDSALLNSNEVEALLGKDLQNKRTADQVLDIISRRIDYVQQNNATIEKQLDAVEKQLAGVELLLDPGVENEDGLPMIDIEEELDDDGNEVASSVNQTGKASAEIVEVLRKVGIQRVELEQQQQMASKRSLSEASALTDSEKTVSFTDENNTISSKKRATLETDGYNDLLADMNFTRGTKVVELDQDDNEIASYPIIPQGESPEDTQLRWQMLQYGLSEVGQIVAELDLDHPTVEYEDDEDDHGDETDDDENEDEHGRSTRSMITGEYRKQMLELEKKLNARMMENVGPKDSNHSLSEHASDVRMMRVREDAQFDSSSESATPLPSSSEPKRKGVRFAANVDVSQPPESSFQPSTDSQPMNRYVPTISDTIVERSASKPDVIMETTKSAKVPVFRSGRAGNSPVPQALPMPSVPQPPTMPTGPRGRTLANTVMEHGPSAAEPNAPDEFDAILLHREIQAEYHKARNRFIQQQGGFKPTEEDEEGAIMKERDGKTKKVSRFMAARLKANGM
ncbi:Prefoldin subunit-domain-containing protein [Phaeosphaeriaceae sp. PMI808]|nr:Prefoldin subunit-domain-containing protein [Phaeosphaeriaceae sp. PMI808]